jgi:hypothetical protein
MRDIVRGMLVERGWSSLPCAGDLPDYATYLRTAMRTISMWPYTVTTCVVADELPAVAAFGRLDPLIRTAARCFRLANDLRSDARERAEGKPNAVTLVQRDLMCRGMAAATAAEQARALVRTTCAEDLALLGRQRAAAPGALATLAGFLHAHTGFVCDLYDDGDYDTVSAALNASAGRRLVTSEV